MDSYPELSFVLIGDSGERDAEIYEEFLESDGDRIKAALIRDVHPAAEASDDSPVAASGILRMRDAEEMAEACLRLGLIDELTVDEVRTEIDARL